MSLHRFRIVRVIRARPRLFIAAAVAAVVGWALPYGAASHPVTRALIAWNVGAVLYVLLAAVMMIRSSEQQMRRRAQWQDEGQLTILAGVVIASVASLVAIAGQLSVAKDMHGPLKVAHIALAGGTVLSSWAFIQVMFTLHYAHDFYAAISRHEAPPLQFPSCEAPGYGDFFYFSAVIGTSGQTADVAFASKPLRRIGSVHCILSYLFNTTVLALLINIGSGLL